MAHISKLTATTALALIIDARFGARGVAVAQAWNAVAAEMQQRAITDWINADLPGRYLTQN
ncbi:hypothetical protein MWU60_01525 [Yoonia sp. F2084L]|uniref:hypothetical protein n=1 Tax=Yoonia sp. F2084L TaxID=2926419 RepID=UPI001FF4B87A|nr:hypothetical protein [Yoonia sp. F2084L]MCK0094235.1 hypothetical protein [Yoonia sp. F2084L]